MLTLRANKNRRRYVGLTLHVGGEDDDFYIHGAAWPIGSLSITLSRVLPWRLRELSRAAAQREAARLNANASGRALQVYPYEIDVLNSGRALGVSLSAEDGALNLVLEGWRSLQHCGYVPSPGMGWVHHQDIAERLRALILGAPRYERASVSTQETELRFPEGGYPATITVERVREVRARRTAPWRYVTTVEIAEGIPSGDDTVYGFTSGGMPMEVIPALTRSVLRERGQGFPPSPMDGFNVQQ